MVLITCASPKCDWQSDERERRERKQIVAFRQESRVLKHWKSCNFSSCFVPSFPSQARPHQLLHCESLKQLSLISSFLLKTFCAARVKKVAEGLIERNNLAYRLIIIKFCGLSSLRCEDVLAAGGRKNCSSVASMPTWSRIRNAEHDTDLPKEAEKIEMK